MFLLEVLASENVCDFALDLAVNLLSWPAHCLSVRSHMWASHLGFSLEVNSQREHRSCSISSQMVLGRSPLSLGPPLLLNRFRPPDQIK